DFVIVSGVSVVMMVVIVAAARTALAFIAVGMIVVMIMVVSRIGMLLCQELRINVQNGVQVETADFQQILDIGFTKVNRRNGGARIDTDQTGAQGLVLGIVDQIFFGDQQAVRKANLFLGFFLLVQRGHAMFGVHHGDDRVQPIVVGNIIVHEEGLTDRAGV